MQNHERKSGMGEVATTVIGLALAYGLASGSVLSVKGYGYVYPNNPPFSEGYCLTLKRLPLGDSIVGSLGPTDGYYDLDCGDLTDTLRIGDTLLLHAYNSSNPKQCADLVVPVDTLPCLLYLRSMVLRDFVLGTDVFCPEMERVTNTSGTQDPLTVAFWTIGGDTAHASIPPFEGNRQFDSLRLNTQLLNKNVGNGEPISLRIYRGELSDTTSAFTDTTVFIQRYIGGHKNDAMRIPNMFFPKTVLTHDAGLEAIIAPAGNVKLGQIVTPQSLVRNYGEVTSIIPVYFSILDSLGREIYRDSAETDKLLPESTQIVSFRDWTAVKGQDGNFHQRQNYRTYTPGKGGKLEVVPETNLILPKSYVESEIADGRAQVLPASGQIGGSMVARSWTNIAGDVDHGNDSAEVNLEVTGIHEYNSAQVPKHKSPQSPCRPAALAANLEARAREENVEKVELRDVSGRIVSVGSYSDVSSGVYLLRTMYRLQHAKHQEAVITDKVVVKK